MDILLTADRLPSTSSCIPRGRTEGANLIWYISAHVYAHLNRTAILTSHWRLIKTWHYLKSTSIQVSPDDQICSFTYFLTWFDCLIAPFPIFKFGLNSHPLLFPALYVKINNNRIVFKWSIANLLSISLCLSRFKFPSF